MNKKLPNFLIVGAAKCGTSSLHYYLNQHPDIFMPTYTREGLKVKEPRFLISDQVKNRLPKGIWNFNDYKALFDDVFQEQAIGESTVLYLYYYEEAIRNIKKYLGNNVKIIIMLRNPIERAYSAYLFASRTNQECQSFEEALKVSSSRYKNDKTLSPMILYKEMGLYYSMVKSYIEHFKDVHIIFYDNFVNNTDIEVRKVFDFLNVSNNHEINTRVVVNSGGRKWRSNFFKDLLMNDGAVKNLLKLILPEDLRVNIKSKLTQRFTQKAEGMQNVVKQQLIDYFKNDIERLECLVNKDLSRWKKI